VAMAIFSSTATTIAVFLPLGLIGGIIGEFFLPFGLAVTYALAASFVVAITVVPALAFLLIRKEHLPDKRETRMQRWYTPILSAALNHRLITMAVSTLLFVGSLFLLTTLPQSFIPSIGEATVNTTVSMPAGTAIAETDGLVREYEERLSGLEGVKTVQSEVGSGGGFEAFFGGSSVSQNLAAITISTEDPDSLEGLTREARGAAEDIFGTEHATVSAAAQAGFGGFNLVIAGDSLDGLRDAAVEAKSTLATIDNDGDGSPDLTNIATSLDGESSGQTGNIMRVDGQPAISITADLETRNTLGVTEEAKSLLAGLASLPAGAVVSEGFQSSQQTEGFQGMVTAIGYSVVLVYIVMALAFGSLIHPFTILFSLPFALVGAAIALFVTNSVLGIASMIGIMMLVGIVVTNAIVLMELVQQLRKKGIGAREALMQAGRTRLRPIWMTAITAILALVPLAASQEAGALIASELAITVIGGLLVSTLLTLVVVPVVYSMFDQVGQRFRRS